MTIAPIDTASVSAPAALRVVDNVAVEAELRQIRCAASDLVGSYASHIGDPRLGAGIPNPASLSTQLERLHARAQRLTFG